MRVHRVGPGEDPRVLLLVRDRGPPIAAEHRPHLFEPFWRADPARSEAGAHCGIGLGHDAAGGVVAALRRPRDGRPA